MRPAWTGGATVRAIQAGADVALLPRDTRVAIQSLVRAVREGQLTEARIDASVRRLLEAKARLGLHRERRVDPLALGKAVARPRDVARAREIAGESITVVRNEGDVLPLAAEKPLRILQVVVSSRPGARGLSRDAFAARRVEMETRVLGPEVSETTARQIADAAQSFTHIVISAYVRVASGETGAGSASLTESQGKLLRELASSGRPTILISLASPYLLTELPDVAAYVCTYSWSSSSLRCGGASALR